MEPDLGSMVRKSDYVYEHVRRRARDGELRPLRRLTPQDLDRQLRAGITPSRDALLRLHAEGYVKGESGRGYWTKLVTVKEQRDLQDMLLAVLMFCLSRAARNTPEALAQAGRALAEALEAARAEAPPVSARAWLTAQEVFLTAVVELSGNDILPRLVANALDRTHHVRRLQAEDPDQARAVGAALEAIRDGALAQSRDLVLAGIRQLAFAWIAGLETNVPRANGQIATAHFP